MFCCNQEEAGSPQHKIHQKRLEQQRRRRHHRHLQQQKQGSLKCKPVTPTTARKLADLDRRPTSPKRVTKDVGGNTPQIKNRLRHDSEGRSKIKVESSNTAAFKERAQDSEQSASGKIGAKPAQRQWSHENPLYGRHGRHPEECRNIASNETCSSNNRGHPSQIPVVDVQPGVTVGKERNESRPQGASSADSRYALDKKVMSYEEIYYQGRSVNPRQQQGQIPRPKHGILKDSGNKGSSRDSQDGSVYHYGSIDAFREGPYGQNPYAAPRPNTSGPNSDQVSQQNYGSLLRGKKLSNPPVEGSYDRGSIPDRYNPETLSQHGYSYAKPSEEWRPHPTRRESDSGYSRTSTDRDHSDNTYAVINYSKKRQIVCEAGNKNYAIVTHVHQPQRPDSVPPFTHDSPESLYGVTRPGSVPPSYYSDSETANYQRRSKPCGSREEIYGVLTTEYPGRARKQRNYETASDYASGSSCSLRARPEEEKYRSVRRGAARRNGSVVSASRRYVSEQETEKKREAFMQLLAQRYPQYADKIQGVESEAAVQALQQDRPSRSREVQRRRTAVVTYNPSQAVNTLEYDDLGTMSDLELPSFQRGGFMRTSLPIVRSASTSLERPLGLVFLVYGDQTKKSMLPNEITTLDTVRALFVRAFPDLTLEILEDPRKKIYLLDPATNIYFQLEDLMDIKDRSVLKIHETDSDQPQKVREKQEVRGRTVQMPVSRPHSRQIYGELPLGTDVYTKSQPHPPPPLQPQTGHTYPEMMQEQRNLWEMDRRSRSRTPEYAERPRSLSAGASSRQRFSHSPDRLPTPERAPLNPIPENRQLPPGYQDQSNYYETVGPGPYRGQYLSGIYESPAVYQSFPPPSPIPNQQTYIAHSTRAPSMAHPQRAVTPVVDLTQATQLDGGMQHPHNYCLPPTDRDAVESSSGAPHAEDMTTDRIDKMEQQLASLTAWVHYQKDGTRKESTPVPRSSGSMTSDGSGTLPASSASKLSEETPVSKFVNSTKPLTQLPGLSDICGYQRSSGLSSRESTPVSVQVEVSARMAQLRSDLHVLRRQQQLNMEAMRDEFLAAYSKIKKVLHSIPGSQNQMIFHKRNEATLAKSSYLQDKHQTDKEISDLEASVEELRADVISRQCRVNASDVEAMALLLSNITKSLADLKTRFPELQNLMKHVMDAELRVVVAEEKFLKEEPTELEQYLKRCKKITGTLYTLKRLASVQDHRPPQVPNMAPPIETSLSEQKKALLENIRALVPDHEQRMKEMEAADASRERKKKISSQQEALKFGKSLEIASRNLRPPSVSNDYQHKDAELDDGYTEERGQSTVAPAQHMTSTTIHSMPPSAIVSSMTSTAPSSTKSSFSTSTAAATKPMDKPTATVSAMTAGVSETVTVMTSGRADKESGTHITKTTVLPLTQSAEHQDLTSTHSIQVGTDSPQKKDATVYAYQISGSVNPVFPVSHSVFNKHENLDSNPGKISDKLTHFSADSGLHSNISTISKPSDLPLYKPGISKTGSSSDSATTYGDIVSAPNTGSPDSKDKADFTSHKHAARSAFFSSMNTPPDSPSTTPPIRNSHDHDRGHSSSTSGVKLTQSFHVNQDPSSAVSTRSSIGLESFTNTSSSEATSAQPVEMKASSVINSPTRGIPRHVPEHKPSSSSDTHSSSDFGSKQKKVPPPPPPRKGSRPTSANMSPVHIGPLDSPEHQSKDIQHRFAGGMLGHHRLSGGPLFSTPKPLIQQKAASRFEQDIASGIYANMNRPDIQNQNTSPQEMMTQANILNNKKPKKNSQTISPPDNTSIPPPPSVTIALDREERASSSESSSSSSGASMGSQQSVVSVIKSPTTSDKSSSKPKPDPPKRQSSLLAKFTGSKDSKNKVKNGKAKGSGVDL